MPVTVIAVFLFAALIIGVFGVRLAGVVDRLADRTGWGEALAGAVLLAGATSVAGLLASVTAASAGDASLAISNSVGGIAVQTAFIVAADLAYRPANIEHAAASLTNIFYAVLVVALLAIVVMGTAAPAWTVADVHPATGLLVGVYAYGVWLARRVGVDPLWEPTVTSDTRADEPDEAHQQASLTGLLAGFVGLAVVVAAAGYAVGRSGLAIVDATGIGSTVVGAFLTSVATSLPELVTTIAAVRAGALTLAIGGLVGGNSFDMLFVAASDVFYREGSLYAAATAADVFVLGWTMLLVAILGAGLIRRERKGIGFEGAGILALYLIGIAVVSTMG